MTQKQFNHYVCQLLLTMLERNPAEGELDEVKSELRALMSRFEPKRPPRPREYQPNLVDDQEVF